MTKDEFFNGVSKPVNEEFAKIFMQLNYMEQSGKGVPTVVSKYGKDVYHFGSSFIQCILPYNILDKTKQERLLGRNEVDNEVDNEVEKDDTLETRIISLIKGNAYISKAKMAEKTGKSVSTIERLLRKSTQIVRIGGAKGGHWEVKD